MMTQTNLYVKKHTHSHTHTKRRGSNIRSWDKYQSIVDTYLKL